MSTTSLVLFATMTFGAEAPQTLERELLRQAKEVMKYSNDKGYKNIGVLKFQITKDGKNLSDNVGTLNMFLARRLEVALVLADDARKPIGIVNNASAVAKRTKDANHLTKVGRLKLFEASYPLAWGKTEVKPDAFITGAAEVSQDLKTLQVQMLVFDKTDNKLLPLLKPFTVANRPEQLGEIGESFNTRGLFDDGDTDEKKIEKTIHQAELVKNQKKEEQHAPATPAKDDKPPTKKESPNTPATPVKDDKPPMKQDGPNAPATKQDGPNAPVNPVKDAKSPVKLEVIYDGKVMPFDLRDGKAYVAEPNEGQKIVFVLKHDGSPERYGVVLKVNGENTIERQRLPDLQCRYWVLAPDTGPFPVDGYLKANNVEKEEFRVLSAPESKTREIDYGADVGTITLSVFRELKGKKKAPEKAPDMDDDAKESRVVNKGTLDTKPQPGEPDKPDTFGALTARLLDDANRGLIAEGQTKPGGGVNVIKFEADPLPVMSLTIIYYNPSNLPK